MKNGIYFFTIIIQFVIISCSNPNKDGGGMQYVLKNESTIHLKSTPQTIKLSLLNNNYEDFYSYVDSIKLIKLESLSESIIGKVSKLFIVNDTLFIADYYKAKSIFAFDCNGKFLYKINHLGQGPGEYQSINMVHLSNGNFIILDWHTWKIIKYDLKGNFISEKKISPCPTDFVEYENDKMIFAYNKYTTETPCQLVFSNENSETSESALPFKNTREIPLDALSRFQKTENGMVLYYYSLCDTIFQIQNNEITAKYDLSFYSAKEIDTFFEQTKDLDDSKFSKQKMESDIVREYLFVELNDVLYVNYVMKNLSCVSLVSKKDYKSHNFIAADAQKKISYNPFIINGFHQNSLLASIDELFLTLTEKNKEFFYSHLKKSDVLLLKELENTDNNAVVCILYLKKI